MKRTIFLLTLIVPAFLASCLEDKSKYGDNDINMVSINVPDKVTIPFTAGGYRFDIADYITQSHASDISNLSFKWGWDYEGFQWAGQAIEWGGDIKSFESYVDIEMETPETIKYFDNYYRVNITDNLTNITYHVNLLIKIRVPYEGSWMILHRDGGTKVGCMIFNDTDDYTLDHDVFGSSGAAALSGNPVALGVFAKVLNLYLPPYYESVEATAYYQNLFFVVTDNAQEAGVYYPLKKFAKTRAIAEMVSDPNLITSQRLAKTAYLYGTQEYMSMVIDGRLYQSKYGLRFYEAPKDDTAVPGDYYITHAIKFSSSTMLYDKIGRRILYYVNYRLTGHSTPIDDPTAWNEELENSVKINNVDREINGITVNPLPEDRELIYFGQGPYLQGGKNFQMISAFALAIGKNGNSNSYVYRFNCGYYFQSSGTQTVLDIKEFSTPEGLTEQSCFASTVLYEGLVFYSSGSKIYRLDYNTGMASVIYEHATGGNIEVMKFARSENLTGTAPSYEEYGYAVTYSLGVGINNGAKGEFVVLELSTSGHVSTSNDIRPSKTTVTGFGEIKDIVFL